MKRLSLSFVFLLSFTGFLFGQELPHDLPPDSAFKNCSRHELKSKEIRKFGPKVFEELCFMEEELNGFGPNAYKMRILGIDSLGVEVLLFQRIFENNINREPASRCFVWHDQGFWLSGGILNGSIVYKSEEPCHAFDEQLKKILGDYQY